MTARRRCVWAESDPLLRDYRDTEWGVPERDPRALWEKLMLDGFQAGLSWLNPTQTDLSVRISKALKQRGYKFVGPTIVYAWMQAVGIVNDHSEGCFRRREVMRATRR